MKKYSIPEIEVLRLPNEKVLLSSVPANEFGVEISNDFWV